MSDTPKPPFVLFEVRALEDRQASIEAGQFRTRDVNFAIITPAGSRDRIEKVAEEWLKDLEEGVRQERFPAEWLDAYHRRYSAFKESREIPEDGTPVRDWPSLSPSQVKLLLDLNIRTIEQTAEANEETISRIGMGGRALKSQAQAWLDAAKGQGKLAGELNTLRKQVEELAGRNATLEERNTLLEAKVQAFSSADDPVE
jgi:hypothetical protein